MKKTAVFLILLILCSSIFAQEKKKISQAQAQEVLINLAAFYLGQAISYPVRSLIPWEVKENGDISLILTKKDMEEIRDLWQEIPNSLEKTQRQNMASNLAIKTLYEIFEVEE